MSGSTDHGEIVALILTMTWFIGLLCGIAITLIFSGVLSSGG